MCGIVGVVARTSHYQVSNAELALMQQAISHRGPDGEGRWVHQDGTIGFAHQRLSIVDLTTNANQPMHSQDGATILCFNGEIYNHLTLRKILIAEGAIFNTHHSDTEVLLHGYRAWGLEGLLTHIEGDFAFAIWDERQRKLLLARDPAGVKPLYLYESENFFAFASEIKALSKHPLFKLDRCDIALVHYLSFLTTPAPLTLFQGVYKVPAGYAVVIQHNTVHAFRYWAAVGDKNISVPSLAEAVSTVKTHFTEAVEKRLMTDVPLGVFLSGGVDSTAILGVATKALNLPMHTFSVGFKDYTHLNELDYARLAAKQYGAHYNEVLINSQDMQGYIHQLMYSQDEPIADWVCIPLYFVSKLARDAGMKVVLVGEGSDEQFCGYDSYMMYLKLYKCYFKPFQNFLPKLAQQTLASLATKIAYAKPQYTVYADAVNRAAQNREHFWSGATVFWDLMKERLLMRHLSSQREKQSVLLKAFGLQEVLSSDTFDIIERFGKDFDQNGVSKNTLNRMIYNEFQLRLPELLLMRVDKVTMSVSLEARVPFLDKKLIDYTQSIPQQYKIQHGPKTILKQAMKGIVPDTILQRRKMGFAAPMAEWLRESFGRKVYNTIMQSDLVRREKILSAEYIDDLFKAHNSGKMNNSLYLWSLYNLCAWHALWFEQGKVMEMHQ